MHSHLHSPSHTPSHSPAPASASRRQLLLGAGALLAGCSASLPAQPRTDTLQLLGETTLRHRMVFRGTSVGGLSAIDYDPATGLFDLLSDDRSDLQPARLYRARMVLTPAGLSTPELLEVVTLRQANGQPWPGREAAVEGVPVPDPESLRRLPGGHFLWGSEGDFLRGFPPAIYEADAAGVTLREFELPGCFTFGPRHGARNNLAFEGLAVTDAGTRAWASMESALQQDGPRPAVGAVGGPCRFTQFDVRSGRAVRQIAYVPDAIPAAPLVPGGFADNGVSEILSLDEHRLLVLERAYVMGRGNSLRLYRIDPRDASDTLALDALVQGNHRPTPKVLVADFANLGLRQLDNTEGMTWGPPLPDGRRTLWVVSDDNFNPLQVTQIAVFAFSGQTTFSPLSDGSGSG